MIKRITVINLHLYLSGIILVFMLLMGISGALHLLTGDESETVIDLKSVPLENIDLNSFSKVDLEKLFVDELSIIDPSYSFSYIKGSDKSLVSRPTTRIYYTIKIQGSSAHIQKHTPSISKKLMEFHKGHGVQNSRLVLGLMGLVVIGAVLSGLWLGISSKAFRKVTFISTISGLIIYLIFFFL